MQRLYCYLFAYHLQKKYGWSCYCHLTNSYYTVFADPSFLGHVINIILSTLKILLDDKGTRRILDAKADFKHYSQDVYVVSDCEISLYRPMEKEDMKCKAQPWFQLGNSLYNLWLKSYNVCERKHSHWIRMIPAAKNTHH